MWFEQQAKKLCVIAFCFISIWVCAREGAKVQLTWGSLKIAVPILILVIVICLVILAWTIGMDAP